MVKIILNNNNEFTLNTFSHSTNFYIDRTEGNSYCDLKNETTTIADLYNLAGTEITSIKIKNLEDEIIYTLENISAYISMISETLNNMNSAINVGFSLRFE